MFRKLGLVCVGIFILLSSFTSYAQVSQEPEYRLGRLHLPVVGRYGMVSSQEELASGIGAEILEWDQAVL